MSALVHAQEVRAAIARRYRAKRAKPAIASLRIRDMNRLFRNRYGEHFPDDDAGRDDLRIFAHHLAGLPGDPVSRIRSCIGLRAPWMTHAEAERLTARVVQKPLRYGADTLAWRLGLRFADRQRLGITTIGALDCNKAQREELRAQRHNERRRQQREDARRAAGKPTREEYIAGSVAEACRQAGISTSTYYRRLRKGLDVPAAVARQACNRLGPHHSKNLVLGGGPTRVTGSKEAREEEPAAVVRLWSPEHERIPTSLDMHLRRENLEHAVKRALGVPIHKPLSELPDVLEAWHRIPFVADGESRCRLDRDHGYGELSLTRLAEALVAHGARQRLPLRQRIQVAA